MQGGGWGFESPSVHSGRMAEWLKALVLKTGVGIPCLPWVRIPLLPFLCGETVSQETLDLPFLVRIQAEELVCYYGLDRVKVSRVCEDITGNPVTAGNESRDTVTLIVALVTPIVDHSNSTISPVYAVNVVGLIACVPPCLKLPDAT